MNYVGKIEKINHIVISDPTYTNDVKCRYEKDNFGEKDWAVDLNITPVETKVGEYHIKGYDVSILLKKNSNSCKVDNDGNLKYYNNIDLKEYTIGMDSACVAFGVNDKAKEIINSQEEWQPPCAIKTGGDGIFGEVIEGFENGKTSFIWITGYFEDEFVNENELFDYLIKQFELKELNKENLILNENNRILKKEETVEHNNEVGSEIQL